MTDISADVVILGTGPGGLQAAIHAARAKASVVVMGRETKSSLYRAHVENYCCLGKISGERLLQDGVQQAKDAGAEILHEDVVEILPVDPGFVVATESERRITTHTLILAMGISRNRIGVPGEKDFLGKGVSYCVDCDANFFKGETVAVVGNESAAVAGALTLLFYAREVHLVAKKLDVSDRLAFQVQESDVILHSGRSVTRITGQNMVEGLELDDGKELKVNGVFIETGAKGAVELAGSLGVALDPEQFKYIVTDKTQQTNVPGVYAAGDICGPPWQMAKAVGEGCVAGLAAAKFAKKQRAARNDKKS
ncbi:Thioredoxin reductase (EC [Olavius algarvensis associated proteobacterium Delta 3]|nr:Thioredoxin reductase (EC [Olavius algarvensis associated proteobacterium Delta 3]CAB5112864.1 Thioredoxin reductase (EC [Olavius algarvensis associated proteobacterium Delta 3]